MFIVHHDPEVLAASIFAATSAAGCDCDPELELDEHGVHGVYVAHVSHDDGCTLLARKSSAWN